MIDDLKHIINHTSTIKNRELANKASDSTKK